MKLRAMSYGAMVFVLMVLVCTLAGGGLPSLEVVLLVALASAAVTGVALGAAHGMGAAWRALMMQGSSTPYLEQYSLQDALVMQGRIDEAIRSFEEIIASSPDLMQPRIRAAEIYSGKGNNPDRAVELLREVQRHPAATASEDIYASNRMVDLYLGPLRQPGRAQVELRRLIERYPTTAMATKARAALRTLKEDGPSE